VVTLINSNALISDLQRLKFDGSLSVFKDYFYINTSNIHWNDIKAIELIAEKYGMVIDHIELNLKALKIRIVVK
jgi:hypothetical protein